jgi:hypothetical protein
MVGDEIKQRASGLVLRVIAIGEDSVTWQRKTKIGWQYENSWTLRGWRDMVAHNSDVLNAATDNDK